MVDRANSSEFIKIGLNLKIAFDSSVVGMVTVYGLAPFCTFTSKY